MSTTNLDETPTEESSVEAQRMPRVASGGLLRFVLRRLGVGVLLVFGIALVTFCFTYLVPADPTLAALGESAMDNPAAVEAFRERHRLDDPIPVQFAAYLGNLLQGDLGQSQRTSRPVGQDLAEYIPATIELAVVAITFAIIAGLVLGTVAAVRRDGWIDQIVRVFSLVGVSMPSFWLALIAFYWLSFKFQIFPGIGRLDPIVQPPPTVTGMHTIDAILARDWETFRNAASHILLPAMVLAAQSIGMLTRFTRSAVLEVLSEDYVRTAKAKGLRGRRIVRRYVLRAALVPIVTLVGLMFGSVLSGTVLIESIFSWPGVGQYAFLSANYLDVPAITGVAMFVAVAYIAVNIIVDILYGVIDPRIRVN